MKTTRALALYMVLLAATSAFAQIDTGTITGRVTDPTGAVVLGAQVTVTSTETNFQNVTTTNAEGIYRVQSLRPGPYRITFVVTGFKRLVREDVNLHVNDTMGVDAILAVGATTESVQVSGALPQLEAETSSTGQVMEGDYFYKMPIYERWVKGVLFLTPGMTYANGGGFAGGLYAFHINGQRPSDIGYFEDGMLADQGDGYSVDTIANTVDEIKVLTSTLPAEYGHSAGGAITVVKIGGTNEIHGIASEFGRTRMMQHRKFFDFQRLSQPFPGMPNGLGMLFTMPDLNLNGPVFIPKIYNGKNKTFFMVGYQKLIEKQGKLSILTVPTPAMKAGDFTFGGIGQQIFDPRTTRQDASGNWVRDPFVGNMIPVSQFNNVAKALVGVNPWNPPNQAGSLTTNGPSGNAATGFANFCDFPTYALRLDQQFTQNIKAFGSSTWGTEWCKNDSGSIVQDPLYDPNKAMYYRTQSSTSVGLTWVFSPTLISDTRVGYYRQWFGYHSPYFLSISDIMVNVAKVPNIPAGMYVSPIQGLGSTSPTVGILENNSFKEDLTKVSGKHAFKMGYDYLRLRQNTHSISNATGTFNFAGTNGLLSNGSATPNTGNAFAAFLVGSVSSASFSQPGPSWLPRDSIHSFYFQDDWKVTPNLTLNLGLRYSNESPLTTKFGQISVWDPTLKDDVYTGPGCPAGGCVGGYTHPAGAFYNRDNNNFQPRFGVAWHPLPRVVWRAGFALSTIDNRIWYNNQSEYSASTNQQQAVGNPTPLYQIDRGPAAIVYPAQRADGSYLFSGQDFSVRSGQIVPKDLHNPYALNWNAGLQYQLARNYLVDLTYAGSAAVGLIGTSQWNTIPWGYLANDPVARDAWIPVSQYSRPWANWGTVNMTGNYGHSIFHSGTVKVEKRYSGGLDFLAFYTFEKGLSGGAGNRYLTWSLLKQRNSFDQNHVFTGSMMYEIPVGQRRKFMNRGGWMNAVFGDFNFIWTTSISSGSPLNVGITGANTQNYPSWMPGYGNVILSQRPTLRNNWQDIGGDRYTQANQNSLIDCGAATSTGNNCFSYVPSYSIGNDGSRIWNAQRIIAASAAAYKEFHIHERLRFQFRFDFQNPFKWYNLGTPVSTLDLKNPRLFGTIPLSEGTTGTYGGMGLMNITLAMKW